MSIAYWCILTAAILPYFSTMLAKAGANYDNYAPRVQLEQLEGYRKRAYWSQLNAFEAFPAFAAAVIIAQLQHVTQTTVDILALNFIALRILHAIFYLFNKAMLRSLVWMLGFAQIVALFVLAGNA